jgi:DNA-binding CsgD family transcriptional regulator
VIEEDGSAGHFRFCHSILREILYQDLSPLERATAHSLIANALESDACRGLSQEPLVLAYHLTSALPLGSAEKACAYARYVGEQARCRLAYEEAAQCFRMALAALDRIAAPDAASRCRLLIALADALLRAGQTDEPLNLLHDAAERAMQVGAAGDLAEAAILFEEVAWRLGRSAGRAEDLLRRTIALVSDADQVLLARLQTALVRALVFAGNADAALRLHEETLERARKAGDPSAIEGALRSRFWLPWRPAELDAVLEAAEESVDLCVRLGNQERELDALAFRVHLSLTIGDVDRLRADLHRLTTLAKSLAQPFHRYHAASLRAAYALLTGDLGSVEQFAASAYRAGIGLPGLDASGPFGMQMFTLVRERGELRQLAPAVQQFIDAKPHGAIWRPALAVLLAEVGDLQASRGVLQQMAEDGYTAVGHDTLHLACLVYLAEACALTGAKDHAPRLRALLSPWSGRNLVAGPGVVCFGPADRYLGMLAVLEQDWTAAGRYLQAAVHSSAKQGAMPWLAHALHEFAALLLGRDRTHEHENAFQMLHEARQIADRLGMAELRSRLASMNADARVSELAQGLSRREVQVLRLMTRGKSNQEIAQAICRSPNTVANHVRNILHKLGAANRTEAAALAARRGLI